MTVSMDGQGRLWSSHGGGPPHISVNDGYTVRSYPSPTRETRIFAAYGDVWAVTAKGLLRLEANDWTSHPVPRFDSKLQSYSYANPVAVPRSPGRVFLVTPDELLEYSANTRKSTVIGSALDLRLGLFKSAIPALDGGVWVTAEQGVAKITETPGEGPHWRTYRATVSGLSGFSVPTESARGVLTLTASVNGSGKKAVVKFDGQRWQVLEISESNLTHGWYDSTNALWLQHDNSLSLRSGGKDWPIERQAALSGSLHEVMVENASTFWVATAQGVVRHTLALWTAPTVDGPDEIVNAIVEDRDGRIWFTGDDSLFCFDGERWKRYWTPGNRKIQTLRTGALMAAPDGRIIYQSQGKTLESLEPKSGRITSVAPPAGRVVMTVDRTANNKLNVLTMDRSTGEYFFEVFDGSRFTETTPIGTPADKYGDIRTVFRDGKGAIWFGGSGYAAVSRHGHVTTLDAKQGFPAKGAYTVFQSEPGKILIGDQAVLAEYDGKAWTVLRTRVDRMRRIIRAQDGTIWAASGTGIHHLKNGAWIPNGAAEGLASDIAYTVFEDSKGRIWAGTTRGVSRFNPQADSDPPRTLISETDNQLETPPNGEANITFSGIDKWKFTDSSRLLFSYRLDGKDWSGFEPGGSASLHNLRAGAHRFEVRAMDRNGNVDAIGKSLAFHVPLPWYLNGWVLTIIVLSITTITCLLALASHNYRQLKRAKIAAESASKVKGDFLANMSHEIRTPMNGILGMTELALDLAVNADQREYLRTVKDSADALMSILNDILDFSKIEAGKLELSAIEFDIQDCVGDCLQLLAVRASEKGIELTVDIRPDIPATMIGDPGRVRQVLMNLVGNALKFTEKGGVAVQVSLDQSSGTLHTLHFMVADTGIGVPEHKQKQIFAPFEQADTSTTRRYGGTGLGLTISVELVQLMNGRIWIESPWTSEWRAEGGPGSAFHFTVQLEAGKGEIPVFEPAVLKELAVLIVDDNRTNRFILSQMFSHWGMKPCCVESGAAAVEALSQAHNDAAPFSLVILDFHMPDMDGFTTAEQIRKKPELSATKIVMLTSSGSRGDGARCAQSGIHAYLLKPARRSYLFDTICTVMGTKSPEGENAPVVTQHSLREARKKLRILVAEDNLVNQRLALRLLEKLGHSVVLANNGREAVDIFGQGAFDVVLMDIQMPEVSGFEATAAIRQSEIETGGHIPIYALTAHAIKGDRERCLGAGMDGYLSKPIQSQDLYNLLDAVGLADERSPARQIG